MAKMLDGLVFIYESDSKGGNLVCIQQDLITCKNCLYSEPIENNFGKPLRHCRMYDWIVNEKHFCGYATNYEKHVSDSYR